MKTAVSAGILILCMFLASGASAAPACAVSATSINFGNYDVFSVFPTDSTGTITIDCGPAVTITIGQSSNSGGFNPRKMSSGTEMLNYNLFTDPTMSSVWGDGTSGTQQVLRANVRTATVYGRIFPGQDVSTGFFIDALTVTMTW